MKMSLKDIHNRQRNADSHNLLGRGIKFGAEINESFEQSKLIWNISLTIESFNCQRSIQSFFLLKWNISQRCHFTFCTRQMSYGFMLHQLSWLLWFTFSNFQLLKGRCPFYRCFQGPVLLISTGFSVQLAKKILTKTDHLKWMNEKNAVARIKVAHVVIGQFLTLSWFSLNPPAWCCPWPTHFLPARTTMRKRRRRRCVCLVSLDWSTLATPVSWTVSSSPCLTPENSGITSSVIF